MLILIRQSHILPRCKYPAYNARRQINSTKGEVLHLCSLLYFIMLGFEFHGPFNKDLRLMEKRHKDIHKLRDVMRMLIQEIPLLSRHKNHPLHGEYAGWWECHIEPLLFNRFTQSAPT